jgi:hypothetical protein
VAFSQHAALGPLSSYHPTIIPIIIIIIDPGGLFGATARVMKLRRKVMSCHNNHRPESRDNVHALEHNEN